MLSTTASEARYRAVFDEHHSRIYAYFRRRIGPETARDCTAETFLVAWRRIEDVPDDGSELRWLYTVARNVLRNAYRAKRRSRETAMGAWSDLPDPGDSPEATVVRHEEHRQVLQALAELSERDREILLLSLWEELPRADIAEVVGCSPHAASQRLHRASRRLARQLERVIDAPLVPHGAPVHEEGTA